MGRGKEAGPGRGREARHGGERGLEANQQAVGPGPDQPDLSLTTGGGPPMAYSESVCCQPGSGPRPPRPPNLRMEGIEGDAGDRLGGKTGPTRVMGRWVPRGAQSHAPGAWPYGLWMGTYGHTRTHKGQALGTHTHTHTWTQRTGHTHILTATTYTPSPHHHHTHACHTHTRHPHLGRGRDLLKRAKRIEVG